MTVEKLIPSKLLLPITTGENSAMSQSEFLAITCKLARAWCDWHEVFKPVTKRSNGDRLITSTVMLVFVETK